MPHETRMSDSPQWGTKLMLVGLFVVWSNAFTAIRHLREVFDPMDLVLARFLPVLAVSLPCLLLKRNTRKETIGTIRAHPLKLAGMGLFGVAGYNYFIYLGQSVIKPSAAALVTTLAPLLTLVLSVLLLGERVSRRQTAGMLLAFGGMMIVTMWGTVGMEQTSNVAGGGVRYMLLATLAPLSWSFYTILGKDLLAGGSPVVVTCLPIAIGTIPLLFLADTGFFSACAGMEPSHWLALAYLSLASTLLGFFLWNLALHRLPASSVASFIYLNPPFAALFGWLLFGERITPVFLAGSAVVLAGLYMAQKRQPRRELR